MTLANATLREGSSGRIVAPLSERREWMVDICAISKSTCTTASVPGARNRVDRLERLIPSLRGGSVPSLPPRGSS